MSIQFHLDLLSGLQFSHFHLLILNNIYYSCFKVVFPANSIITVVSMSVTTD